MDLSEENRRRAKFRNILLELARSQDVLRGKDDRIQFYKRLEALYCSPNKKEKYRHFEPPHIVRTVQKRGLQGVEQANQRLGSVPNFV